LNCKAPLHYKIISTDLITTFKKNHKIGWRKLPRHQEDTMFSARLKRLTPYVPGEQPQDKKYLKLNTNENPYPPTPAIKALMADYDFGQLKRYCDPEADSLRTQIAATYGVNKTQVFVGNGSDEVLAFAFYAFFDSTDGKLCFPEFTYSFYPVYCDLFNIAYTKVPLKKDFAVDVDSLLAQLSSCGIIFANPNAPTGICIPLEQIRYLLENYPTDRVVVVDEAYIDFGGQSALALISKFPNLVVVRTLSKSMSLAGLRLGFAIAQNPIIEALSAVKNSFNSYPVDTLAQNIAEAAFKDETYYRDLCQKVIAARNLFSTDLTQSGWDVLPSSANFVFARKTGLTGQEIYLKLKENGILVRYFDIEGIKDFVRITIGTPEEMNRLLEEMRACF
jgi:histidinol-phosphate aminotransferase